MVGTAEAYVPIERPSHAHAAMGQGLAAAGAAVRVLGAASCRRRRRVGGRLRQRWHQARNFMRISFDESGPVLLRGGRRWQFGSAKPVLLLKANPLRYAAPSPLCTTQGFLLPLSPVRATCANFKGIMRGRGLG